MLNTELPGRGKIRRYQRRFMDVQRTGVTEASAMERVRHIQMGATEIFIKIM